MTHNFTLPYLFVLLLRCPISSSLSRLGGAVGGRAVRHGVCVCATATKDRSQRTIGFVLLTTKALSKKEPKPFSFGARHHRGRRACGRELHRESPAGPGTELTVGMHALCVEVPAGHAIGLGVDLFKVYYTPASTDPALRLGLSCDAPVSYTHLTLPTNREV